MKGKQNEEKGIIFQKQDKSQEKNPNEMEKSNLLYHEFKRMVIKMVTKLRTRIVEHSENFSKVLDNIRKNQSELKNTIIERKNTLQGINSRLEDTEEWNSNLQNKIVEITQVDGKKKREF